MTRFKTFIYITSEFRPRVRARALRAPVFLGALPRQMGRCAPPPPIAASLLHIHQPKYINLLFPENKASFRPELGPPGSNIFPWPPRLWNITFPAPRPTCRTLLSYAAPYWASVHPEELCCTLLSYAAPHWAMLHPRGATMYPTKLLHLTELSCALLKYSELYPIVSYAGIFWDTLHPIELLYTAPY